MALLSENLALEIAKSIGASDQPPPEGYAASNRSAQQSLAQTPVGLRLPTTSPDPTDQVTVQSFFKNIVTTNPMIAQTSLSSVVLAAMAQMPDTLPGDVASHQGFAKEDAAQLTTTSLPVNRLQHGATSPLDQVVGSGSRSELWDSAKKAATAERQDEQALSVAKHEVADKFPADKPSADKVHVDKLSDNLQNAMLASGSAQPEHTGIIASFVLNAAMLPGWPIPNQAAMAEFVAKTKMSEEEMLKRLADLGANSDLIEKLKKRKSRTSKKLLIYLAMLLTAVETVIGTLANEVAMLSGEEKNLKERRERADARGHTGARQHVYIE